MADQLGIRCIFLHPLAGVLSAYGICLADLTAMRERMVELELAESSFRELDDLLADAEREA